MTASKNTYAELQVTTNFSFLRGASHPYELVAAAKALGLSAIAVTDRNTLAGVVRAHAAAKEAGLRFIVGARLDFADRSPSVLCYPADRAAYGRLTRLLSKGQLTAEKGECTLTYEDLLEHGEGQILVVVAPARIEKVTKDIGQSLPLPLVGRGGGSLRPSSIISIVSPAIFPAASISPRRVSTARRI